jgi:hypothetical protein
MVEIKGNPVAHLTEYELRHLAQHLEASERTDDLHGLLALGASECRNAWYEAKEARDETAAYLADVEHAWRLAEGRSDDVHRQCRYALVTATIDNLATNIPPGLYVALVEKGVWAPSRGYAYAQRIRYERKRAEALLGLAPYLSETNLRDVLTATYGLSDHEQKQLRVLLELAPRLSTSLLRQMLEVLRSRLQGNSHLSLSDARRGNDLETELANTLVTLAPDLPEALLREAIAVAQEMDDSSNRQTVLAALLPRLAELGCADETLMVIQDSWDEQWRARTLGEIVSYLPEHQRIFAVIHELTLAYEIDSKYRRVMTLASLIPHLPEPGYEAVLTEEQIGFLKRLTRILPETERSVVLAEALTTARTIDDERWQAKALTALVPLLQEVERKALCTEVLLAVKRLDGNHEKMQTLVALCPHLPRTLWNEALEVVSIIRGEYGRERALEALAPHIPEPLLSNALELAQTIEERFSRQEAITTLAPYLSEELLRKALLATLEIPDRYEQTNTLVKLAPHLSEPLLREALVAVLAMEDQFDVTQGLEGLAPYLPEHLLQEGLSKAKPTKPFRGVRTEVIATLAPHLARVGYPGEAVRALSEPVELDARDKSQALVVMAPYLPESLLQEALGIVGQIDERHEQEKALNGLAPYLSKSLLRDGLAMARVIGDSENQAMALKELSVWLAKLECVEQAVLVAQGIQGMSVRAQALTALVPLVSETERPYVLNEALKAAREIEEKERRAPALAALAPQFAGEARPPIIVETLATIRQMRDLRRQAEILAELASQLPDTERPPVLYHAVRLASATKPVVVTPVLDPQQEVWIRRFQKLFRLTGLGHLVRFLVVMWALEDEQHGPESLVGLVSRLPEEERLPVLDEAWAVARESEDLVRRAAALVTLVPHFPESARSYCKLEAAEAILEIEAREPKVRLMGKLAAALPENERRSILAISMYVMVDPAHVDEVEIEAEISRIRLKLGSLKRYQAVNAWASFRWIGRWLARIGGRFPHISPVSISTSTSSDALLYMMLDLKDDHHASDRAYALTLVASHLPEAERRPVLAEAVEAARQIVHKYLVADAMTELVPLHSEVDRPIILAEALAVARESELEQHQVRNFIALAPYCIEAERHTLLTEALAITLGDESFLGESMLSDLVSHLSGQQIREALAAVQTSDEALWRAQAMRILASQLARMGHVHEALTTARAIEDVSQQARALADMVEYLPESLLREALAATLELSDDRGKNLQQEIRNPGGQRVRALALLVYQLAEIGHLDEALTLARQALEDSGWLPILIASLAPKVPEEERASILFESFRVARAITDTENRACALRALAPHIILAPLDTLYPLWCETLHILASSDRKDLLSDIGALVMVIAVQGDTEGLVEVARAIQDVGRWWP